MTTHAQFADETSEEGEFIRQEDTFRDWVSADPATPYPVQAGRYHLYVSLACPWASRALIIRNLKALENNVGISIADPVRDERGWAFHAGPGHGVDTAEHFEYLSEAYRHTDPNFHGRVTVPVLWDRHTRRIVNNSEDDICRMFDGIFAAPGSEPQLFPADLEPQHSDLARFLYEKVNNGVYRAGFATTQGSYEAACRTLFDALDELESRLAHGRHLLGGRIVEADWRLFCTLVRFDAVYYGHFKCNLRRIVDYPNLGGYLRELYQQTGIADTVNFDHIKRHYYITHDDINPTRIVPLGPVLDFRQPHGRDRAFSGA